MLRQNQRALNRAMRSGAAGLENHCWHKENFDAVKIMAKDLIRTRRHVFELYHDQMKEEDVLKFLAASTHLGGTYNNMDFQMEKYIYKRNPWCLHRQPEEVNKKCCKWRRCTGLLHSSIFHVQYSDVPFLLCVQKDCFFCLSVNSQGIK